VQNQSGQNPYYYPKGTPQTREGRQAAPEKAPAESKKNSPER
jgi:hypothetical protein